MQHGHATARVLAAAGAGAAAGPAARDGAAQYHQQYYQSREHSQPASSASSSSRHTGYASTSAAASSSARRPTDAPRRGSSSTSVSYADDTTAYHASAGASTAGTRTSASSVAGYRSGRNSNPRTPPSPARHYSVHTAEHVQAIHNFDASIMKAAPGLSQDMYLAFREGEIIRVHNRDPTGWWDGEIESEPPRRGWFPSNYVRDADWNERRRSRETTSRHASMLSHGSQASFGSYASANSGTSLSGYDDAYIFVGLPASWLTALEPVKHSHLLLRAYMIESRLGQLRDAVSTFIRNIRGFLVRLDLLRRDTPTAKAYPQLGSRRKALLAGLSPMVDASMAAVDDMPEDAADELVNSTWQLTDELMHLFRRFLVEAVEAGLPLRPTETAASKPNDSFRKWASVSDLRGSAKRQGSSPPPPMPNSRGKVSDNSPSVGSSGSGRSSPISHRRRRASSYGRHARTTSVDISQDSPGIDSIASDLSQSIPATFANGYSVHAAVAQVEDSLLSIVASFIGHIHSHSIDSHPSSHAYLIELTREAVDTVRSLLSIAEQVGRQADSLGVPHREVDNLIAAKDELLEAASALVEGAENVANAPFTDGGGEKYDAAKTNLLRYTTTTLRAGSECARVVRRGVPQTEPDYESPDVSSSTIRGPQSAAQSPRRPQFQGIGLGIHGPSSLQSLTRRATSLGQLHARFKQDGVQASIPQPKRNEDDDDEEVVESSTDDEPLLAAKSLPPRRSSRPISQPDADAVRTKTAEAMLLESRHRATSFSSPGRKRRPHHSPTRSSDLDNTSSEQHTAETATSTVSRPSTVTSYSSQTQGANGKTSASETTLDGDLTASPVHMEAQLEGIQAAARNFRPPSGPAPTRPPPPGESPTVSLDDSHDGDVRFWVVNHDYDPREVAFNSEGSLVGGTLRVLIEKMTPHEGLPDRSFLDSFWYTFRLFTTPADVLETLIARYELTPPPVVQGMGPAQLETWVERKLVPVRFRVCICLKTWLDHHWRPESDNAILERLEAFIRDNITPTMTAMGPRLLEVLRKRQTLLKDGDTASIASSGMQPQRSLDRSRTSTISGILSSPNPGSVPTPIISRNLHSQLQRNPQPDISVTDFDTLELARQLTIMESKLFAAVAPADLLMTGHKQVPELKALSTLSNQITGWVADGILNEQDTRHRAALLKFYIKLADKCLMLNNFSTLWAVMAGLNSSTISRLSKTWDALQLKYRVLMDRLRSVIEHTKNHAAYRSRLREVTGPCLPFLGLILSDITFTLDGNPNTRPSTLSPDIQLINQVKFDKLGRIASEFRRFQMPFDLKELDPVQVYLTRVLAERGSGSLDALYRKSLLLEPRQGTERFSSAVERPGWLGSVAAARVL